MKRFHFLYKLSLYEVFSNKEKVSYFDAGTGQINNLGLYLK